MSTVTQIKKSFGEEVYVFCACSSNSVYNQFYTSEKNWLSNLNCGVSQKHYLVEVLISSRPSTFRLMSSRWQSGEFEVV